MMTVCKCKQPPQTQAMCKLPETMRGASVLGLCIEASRSRLLGDCLHCGVVFRPATADHTGTTSF